MRFVRRPRTWAAAALAAALVATAGGCGSKSDDAAGKGGTDKVTYITSFGNFGRDAYVWVALDKGYFKQEGIDVNIEPGTGTTNIQDVASNKAQFTAVDFTGAILQISKAKTPLPVQAVAAIQQNSMAAVMVPAGSGITQPSDLEGKRIADSPGSVVELLFPTYAKLAGFNGASVKFTIGSAQQLPQMLAQHRVDAVDQFVVGKPTVQTVVGKDITVLPFSKYIGDLYGNALWTSTSLIKSNPDLVKRFRDALLKGLASALADPAGAGKILAKHVPTANAQSAAAELSLMKAYVEPTDGGPVGEVTAVRTTQMVSILQGAGAIPSPIDANKLVDFDLVPSNKS